jgi:hypothetical protein
MRRLPFLLIPFLLVGFALGKMPTLEDEHYKTACGPIAGLVALQTLGIEISLDEMAKRCGWVQDEMLPLENLQTALQSCRGISCQIVQLTPKQLTDLLKDDQTVVILATRKRSEEIDHAVCAVGVRDNDQVIHLIDYPELHQRKLIGEIADSWDGVALVVRISPFYRALGDFAVCFAPMVLFIIILLWFLNRKPRKTITVNSLACLLLVLTCLCVSCNKQETSPTQEPPKRTSTPAPAKSTLQNSFFLKHHFGDVNVNEVLSCSLELKNETDKPMSFGYSSTTCGSCLTVKSKPEAIEPGETGIFELEFNTAGRRGATPQNAYFWDAEPKTILVVADIGATVRAIWADPEIISLGNLTTSEPQRAKLYVMAAGLPDAEVTSAQCEAPWLTLTSHPVATSNALKAQSIRAIDYYEIEWTGKEAKPGNLTSKIIIHVQNGDEEKILEIPVSGYLSGDVEIVPSNIVFGRVTKNEVLRTCTLTFKKSDIDATKIKCVADHSYIQVSLEKSKEDSRKFVLNMRLTPPTEVENQLVEGTITGTDESGEVIFTVPYIAFFSAE